MANRMWVVSRATAFFLGAVVLLAVGTILLYRNEASRELQDIRRVEVQSISLLKRTLLSHLFLVESDVRILANSQHLSAYVEDPSPANRRRVAEEFVLFAENRRLYDQVRYLDASGQEAIRVNTTPDGAIVVPKTRLQNKANRYYFTECMVLRANQIYVSAFDLNVENGMVETPRKPMIRFGTPVRGTNGEKRGMVILNYLGSALLSAIENQTTSLRGDPMLLNAEGYWLYGSPGDTDWAFMSNGTVPGSRFQDRFPAVWERMETEERGQVRTANGLFTYERISPREAYQLPTEEARSTVANVDQEQWMLLSRVPQERLLPTATTMLKNLLVVDIALAVAFFFVGWAIASGRYRQIEYHRSLVAAQQKAEAASEAKSQFLANMSHEIRTPLNGVVGMLDLLAKTPVSTEQLEFIQIAQDSGISLLGVINDILDFSKIEAGKLDFETVDFDLREMIEDIAAILGLSAFEKGIEFSYYIGEVVPTSLRGDPGRLRQIINNVVGNAIKFTEIGEVHLEVDAVRQSGKSVVLRFSVSDTGIGIPPDKQKSLFESFYQVDGSSTRRHGGTGLGLTIAHQLVRMMNGWMDVESNEGTGSCFTFVVELEKRPGVAKNLTPSSMSLSGKRVLVVDDNATNLQVFRGYLTGWGCDILEAGSPEEAILLARRASVTKPIDVAIIDYQMPEMDGRELGARLLADPGVSIRRLLLATSQAVRGQAEASDRVGFDGFLTKPIRKSELKETLCDLCAENRADPRPLQATGVAHPAAEAVRSSDLRILVAEDDRINQKVTQRLLENQGFSPTIVSTGKEALELATVERFDLILMDIQMPEMDGIAAVQEIRATEIHQEYHTPVVALTAHAMKGDVERCLAAGMDDYIAKPVHPEQLKATISKYLEQPRPETPLLFEA